MADARNGAVVRQIRSLLVGGAVAGLTDRELLERFNDRRGEAAELAFAVLVERHGPAVLRICRSVLRNPQDAEDAFQAAFLVLVRRAGSLWVGDSLGPWLLAVAHRVASHAGAAATRRARREREAAETVSGDCDAGDAERHEFHSVIHEEIDRLPEGYRVAVLLCVVEGLTAEQASRRLGWPPGTVRSRLARGKARLRLRLARRGLAPAAPLVAASAGHVPAAVPVALADRTARIAALVSAGGGKGVLSASVSTLVKGAFQSVFVARLKLAAAVVTILALGAAWAAHPIRADEPVRPSAQAQTLAPRPLPTWRLEVVGSTAFDPGTIARVRTPVDARVTQIFKTLGKMVKKGDPLVEVYSTTLAAGRIDLLSKYAQWQHDLQLYEKQEQLFRVGSIAQGAKEAALASAMKSRVSYLGARDKLISHYGMTNESLDLLIQGQGQADLSSMALLSPADGRVIRSDVLSGNFYGPADLLMEVADLDHLWVLAEVPEPDRDKIEIGRGVDVRFTFNNRTIRGRVEWIAAEASKTTRTFAIRVLIPNPQRELKVGHFVVLTIDPAR